MIARVRWSGQFKKDYRRAAKRGKGSKKHHMVLELLEQGKPLLAALKDHALVGSRRRSRELHVEPNWLMYRFDGECLDFARMGSHADLFN